MSGLERWAVVDGLGRYLRMYDGGDSAGIMALGWVAADEWHRLFSSEADAAAIAAQVNADNPRRAAKPERRAG